MLQNNSVISVKAIYSLKNLIIPSVEISFHGLGGYMKAAFWI